MQSDRTKNAFSKILGVFDHTSKQSSAAMKELDSIYNKKTKIIHFITIDKLNKTTEIETDFDCIVSIGGDGLMLQTIHRFMRNNIPFYGVNRGSVGFLLNSYDPKLLLDMIQDAIITTLNPLQMEATDNKGKVHKALAVNEISLMRATSQTSKIEIQIDDEVMLDELVSDGVLISTPAGSTAYNAAANGPIIPLNANVLLLTPISPFRPRRWHGAVLSKESKITLSNLCIKKRPLNAVADFIEIKNVVLVDIFERHDIKINLLFNKGKDLKDRILKEQFRY